MVSASHAARMRPVLSTRPDYIFGGIFWSVFLYNKLPVYTSMGIVSETETTHEVTCTFGRECSGGVSGGGVIQDIRVSDPAGKRWRKALGSVGDPHRFWAADSSRACGLSFRCCCTVISLENAPVRENAPSPSNTAGPPHKP